MSTLMDVLEGQCLSLTLPRVNQLKLLKLE
mgnify:CR=1 FL=1